MGSDLLTVDPVPKEDQKAFQRVRGDHGYFRQHGGICSILSHLGVDMKKSVADRTVAMDSEAGMYIYKSMPLEQAMGFSKGFQITPEECQQFSRVLTEDNISRALAATESECPFAIPNNPGAVRFFLDFAEYCKAASKYGGYYNY